MRWHPKSPGNDSAVPVQAGRVPDLMDPSMEVGFGPSGSHADSGRTVEDRHLNAAVTTFETHDIIELSGACLKDDRVLQGCDAVPGSRAEMDCLARKQLE